MINVEIELDAAREFECQKYGMSHFASNIPCCKIIVESFEVGFNLDFFDFVLIALPLEERGVEYFYREEVSCRMHHFLLHIKSAALYFRYHSVSSQSPGINQEGGRYQ